MRAQAGFHGDDARRQLLEDVFESEGNLPTGGEPDEVKHIFSDVDADHHR
jgi:hypothetical protein